MNLMLSHSFIQSKKKTFGECLSSSFGLVRCDCDLAQFVVVVIASSSCLLLLLLLPVVVAASASAASACCSL